MKNRLATKRVALKSKEHLERVAKTEKKLMAEISV